MEIVLGFIGMLVMLIAEIFFRSDDDQDMRRCPRCGTLGVRIPQVWDMYSEASHCRNCGATFRG